jgi:hypothetical protein
MALPQSVGSPSNDAFPRTGGMLTEDFVPSRLRHNTITQPGGNAHSSGALAILKSPPAPVAVTELLAARRTLPPLVRSTAQVSLDDSPRALGSVPPAGALFASSPTDETSQGATGPASGLLPSLSNYPSAPSPLSPGATGSVELAAADAALSFTGSRDQPLGSTGTEDGRRVLRTLAPLPASTHMPLLRVATLGSVSAAGAEAPEGLAPGVTLPVPNSPRGPLAALPASSFVRHSAL